MSLSMTSIRMPSLKVFTAALVEQRPRSGVSVESRRGTEVYDMPRIPLEHGGKESAGHKEESFDVCVDGLDDIIDIVAAVRFETSGESCVIYEDIGGARFGKAAAGSVCTASRSLTSRGYGVTLTP